jgi:N-acylneuraminate cytidylyltransferase|tara:strand:- start:5785 stop:6450 length:666 start_codon:yes stop_codon:yes gene_type:complete
MKNGKLTAIIPVREGSQRVKNKNIKPFAGKTLLELKIETLKKVDGLDEIIVTSDSLVMLDMAKKLDVTTHLRDDYYASNEVNNSDFMYNLATITDSEYIMYSPCTSPLLSSETITECIYKFRNSDVECICTVTSQKHHMWLEGKPLNYDPKNSPNSQNLPDIYSMNYGCCILSKEDMLEMRNVVTMNPTFHITDEIESIDIDTEFDFMVAEFVYNKLHNVS